MAKGVNTGTAPNDGTGQPLRAAFQDINNAIPLSAKDSDFGATGDGTTDDTEAIQAAIDYAYENDHSSVFLPRGVYVINDTLLIPEGIKLYGEGSGGGYPNLPFVENPDLSGVLLAGQTVLFLAAGSNCPMIRIDTARATVLRETTSDYDGRGDITQYFTNVTIAELVLHGNARSQTRHDCDLIQSTDCWGVTLQNVLLAHAAGFSANFWNCNVVRGSNLMVLGDLQKSRGVLLYDTADSVFEGASMAGGFVAPALWIATPTGWLNNFSGLHWGDTQVIESGAEILSVAANVMTVSQNARIETGQPIVFWNHSHESGTLPSGITRGQTYFAIKLTDTTYGFNASLPLAIAGTLGTITDAGTDCWIKCGPSVCLYLSQAVKNIFTGIRFDNGRDGCVVLEDANFNAITSSQITKPGGGTSLDRVGLWVRSGENNIFSDLVFADARNPIRVDAGTNYFGHATFTNCTNPASYSALTRLLVTQNTAGAAALASLSITSPTSTLPLAVAVTDSPTVATFGRLGSTLVSMALRLTETQDGAGRDVLFIADGVTLSHLMGWAGNATLAEGIIGGDSLAAASKTLRLRGGYSTGTNIAGNDVEIVPGGGTGNAAPGKLLLRVPSRNASGVSQQTTHTTALEVSETSVDASKPFLPPRMTKAARNALTAVEGMVVMQTDATPGLRIYQSGAWVAPTVSADP